VGVGGASDDGAAVGPTAGAVSGSMDPGGEATAGAAGVMAGKAAAGAVAGAKEAGGVMGEAGAPENLLPGLAA
jgi:hypothetical protein